MAAEDIRNLQPWTCQQRRALGGQLSLGFLLGLVLDPVLLGPQRREALESHEYRYAAQADGSQTSAVYAELIMPQSVGCAALLEVGHHGGGMASARELTCRLSGWLGSGPETAILAAARRDTSRAEVRAASGKASHSDPCDPCPVRCATSCVWNRYRIPSERQSDSQPRAIADTQRRLVFDARCRLQKTRHLIGV
jgi:hypothetical protein